MMFNTRLIAASIFALALSTGGAAAQSKPGSGCETFVALPGTGDFFRGGYVDTCAAADQARSNTIYVPFVIQRMLARSFGFGPSMVEPAGLSGLDAQKAENRLDKSAITIAPAADTAAAAAPAVKWNGWVDGRSLYTDYTHAAGDLDGPTLTGIAGLDYKLTSKVSLGMIVSAERSDMKSAFTDLDSSTFGGGPYLGIVLKDNLVFSANVQASHMDSSQFGGVLDYDTRRLQSSAALTGYWYKGTWRLTPGVTLAWSKDWEEEITASSPTAPSRPAC